jgi:hypothetical protein
MMDTAGTQFFLLTITTTATEGQGTGTVSSHEAYPWSVLLVAVVKVPLSALTPPSLSLLSPSLFLLPSLFLPPSLLPPLMFLRLPL